MCSLVDNIDVDVATGDLWIGSHPDVDKLLKYTIPPYTSISPSQVLHVCLVVHSTVCVYAGVQYWYTSVAYWGNI